MNLRSSAIVMKNLPATAWGDALLISREEARRIGYELEQAAERIDALEARATPALPDGMAIVPVELEKAAHRLLELCYLSDEEFDQYTHGKELDAIRAMLAAAKEKGE